MNRGKLARKILRRRFSLRTVLVLLCPLFAQAQAPSIPSEVSPGQLLPKRALPIDKPTGDAIQLPSVEPTVIPQNADAIQIEIKEIIIDDNKVFSTDELRASWQHLLGAQRPLSVVYALANTLTQKYRDAGYVLSAVIVPEQTLRDGRVRLRVIEGYISNVSFTGLTSVEGSRIKAYANQLLHERPIRGETLERYLLLMNDLPGVTARAFLKAGPEVGASELVLEITRRRFSNILLGAQTRVSKFLGSVLFDARGSINNAFGADEGHFLTYQGTDEGRLNAVGYSFVLPVGSTGGVFTLSVNGVRARPKVPSIDIASEAASLGVGYEHPFVRSRLLNLRGRINLTGYNGETEFPAQGLTTLDRVRAVRLVVNGDIADSDAGITFGDIELSKGVTGLGSTRTGDLNAARSGADYGFEKVTAAIGRLQELGRSTSILISLKGQYTSDILPPVERMGFGGEQFGRAYNAGEFLGDRAAMARFELRQNVTLGDAGIATLYGFYDYGRVWVIQTVGGSGGTSAAATGAGVRASLARHVNFYVEVAKPLIRPVQSTNSESTRIFAGIAYEM